MTRLAVIGLGSFGMSLATSLARMGAEVIAVDNEMAHVESVKDEVHTAVRMDARDREGLEERGIHRVDGAVVCMGEDFEAAEICAIHLTELGCPKVLVRGTTRERAEILKALVPGVIRPGLAAARELAVQLLAPGVVAYADLGGDLDAAVIEISATMAGSSIGSLKLDDRPGVHLLAIWRKTTGEDEVFVGPSRSQSVREGDRLVLLGREHDLIRAAHHLAKAT